MAAFSSYVRRKVLVVLIALLAFLPASGYTQQDTYALQVRDQLMAAAVVLISAGYELTHEPIIQKLPRGNTYNVSMSLDPGVTYAIVGVCDQDCRDIDLYLYDSKGNLIDYDRGSSDTPLVEVRPAYRDTFIVHVRIPSCSAWQCTFGVGVFGY